MNVSILIGRIATDLELKQTQSGTAMCSFTLAVNRPKKQGEEQQADFIRCKTFGKTAELLNQYQHKGNRLGVVGTIQTGSYQNQDGQTVYTTDVMVNRIEFLESKKEQQPQQAQNMPQAQNTVQQTTKYQNPTNYMGQPQNNVYTGVQTPQNYNQMFDTNGTLDISSDDLPF
ncbi:single-stranded DNA-binding protein [Allobaculum stercoricanis]|uniref:single-stranded DNA-binding protein n=1 Tax=Allobaculum stercoricanis TaxID=174709 RepID=UPI0029432913|nr:single-stranded DNA-binding protein [Allobaculum stercoricanis]